MPALMTLDVSDREKLMNEARKVSFSRHDSLRDRKDCVNALVFILSGGLRIYSENELGKQIMLYYLPPQSVCVLTAPKICQSSPLDYKIQAVVETEAILLSDSFVGDLEVKYPGIREAIDNILASRLDQLFKVLVAVTRDDLSTRLEKYLKYLVDTFGTNEINITHEAISVDLNCSREVVTRLLTDMKTAGQVNLSRNKITVLY